MIFCKISKFHDISMTGKPFIIFPGFPGAVGTLNFTNFTDFKYEKDVFSILVNGAFLYFCSFSTQFTELTIVFSHT